MPQLFSALRVLGRHTVMKSALAMSRTATPSSMTWAAVSRGRTVEAELMTAGTAAIEARPEDAVAALERMLQEAPPGPAGWSIPIEPLLERLRSAPAFGQILHDLARRAE